MLNFDRFHIPLIIIFINFININFKKNVNKILIKNDKNFRVLKRLKFEKF